MVITISEMPKEAKRYVKRPIPIQAIQINEAFDVEAMEGTMHGKPGDWLMKGIRGELYVCDDSIFQEGYELYQEA